MKRIVLSCCLLLASSLYIGALAQKKAQSPEEKAKKTVEKMDALLDLNEKQEAKLLEFYSKPKDQRGKESTEIKKILTESQYKKYQENKAVEKAKRQEKGEKKQRKNK